MPEGRAAGGGACLLAVAGALWGVGLPAAAADLREFRAPRVQAAVSEVTRRALRREPAFRGPLPRALQAPAGVFVTLSREGVVRGCWGTASPQQPRLVDALWEIAPRALVRDRRQRPIQAAELAHLVAHVSILGPLEPLADVRTLDPRRWGLLLTAPGCGGLLLPGEAATPAWAEATCRRKAGLDARVRARMYRFETVVVGPISLGAGGEAP